MSGDLRGDTGHRKFRCVPEVKGRREVLGDLRADAERIWFRCVPEVKRRGAIVLLGASLSRRTRRDCFVGCVPEVKMRSVVEGTVRRHAAQQKDLCVWTQEICSVQCVLYADITGDRLRTYLEVYLSVHVYHCCGLGFDSILRSD